MCAHKVLFVDDEPNVLSAIRRGLRNAYDVHTAEGAVEALRLIEENDDSFSVIVSDCRMPEMDGIQLLEKVGQISPDSTRVMLTGNTDQGTAVSAVNRGEVFKFLNKPCDPDQLRQVLDMGIRQYELVTAERELLEKTLRGSIQVLADLLSIAKPEAFGCTSRLRRKAGEIAQHLEGVKLWELDTAALLSQLGCIKIAQSTLDKLQAGETLSSKQAAEFASHPSLGADLIGRIPRMDDVAKIILYQNKHFDGGGFPADNLKGQDIPLESRILHVVLAYDEMNSRDWSDEAVLQELRRKKERFDPNVLEALVASADLSVSARVIRVMPSEVSLGMVLEEDVRSSQGVMLLCRGQEVTTAIREHLIKFESMGTLTKAILVSVPSKEGEVESA